MIINLLILALFLASGSAAVFMVWRKVPLLLQVPNQLIEESFVTRPSRVKTYLGPLLRYLQDQRYRKIYRSVLVWMLHRVRLSLLRFERVVFRMLEALRKEEKLLSETEERYWSELKSWKQESRDTGSAKLPEAVINSEPPPPQGASKTFRKRTLSKEKISSEV